MRRLGSTGRLGTALVAVAGAVSLATGCTSPGGGTAGPTATAAIAPNAKHAPTTITVWTFNRLPQEVAAYRDVLDRLHKAHPWLTLKFVSGKDDADLAKAVAAGNTPDLYVAIDGGNVGKFCHNGTVLDLNPFLSSAHLDVAKTFPSSVRDYTRYRGKQCALPLLTDAYGLFYNKRMFAAAGIAAPPRTLSELTADAQKLTTRTADGAISRFGFVPRSDGNGDNNVLMYLGVQSGTRFYDGHGNPTFGTNPRWATMLRWDRSLIDWYGASQVQSYVAANNPHSDDAQNPFATGHTAMEFDGEWHIGELADAKDLDYGVAPMPVLDDQPSRYGVGYSAGTVMYLPRATKHPQEAFFAAQQLATDGSLLNPLADAMSNIPTTYTALRSWDRANDPHWKPLIDIFSNPGSYPKQPTAAGQEDSDAWGQFITSYEQGKVPDLHRGLTDFDTKVHRIAQQAGGG